MPSASDTEMSSAVADNRANWLFNRDDNHDPYAPPQVYYGEDNLKPIGGRPRTLSTTHDRFTTKHLQGANGTNQIPIRRSSVDPYMTSEPRKFIVHVESTYKNLLESEDTDKNLQITIEDNGPKVISLGTLNSSGYKSCEIRGTYMLSNLLQELTLAKDYGRQFVIIDELRLNENPVDRLSRLIKDFFWKGLTRRIDGSVIDVVAKDPKAEDTPRIYVPYRAEEQLEYYRQVALDNPDLKLDVVQLPEKIDAEYVKSINDKPGLLALAMQKHPTEDGKESLRGLPFVVPGGRFNELYGWDSYMIALGLIQDEEVELAKSMVLNFCFEIEHYGKILNANRSYYLSRSQPPFLTDMTLKVYEKIKHEPDALHFLKTGILAAIKEYFTVWMAEPRYDRVTGLSRYRPDGKGVPPETEPSHFDSALHPYAQKHNMSKDEFIKAYNDGVIKEPRLDEYFLHDRALRESGHDTTYRFENVCADLATIDLNSLLYKYEVDIAYVIKTYFPKGLTIPAEFAVEGHPFLQAGGLSSSANWERRAQRRKLAVSHYMWNEEKGMFFDYNTRNGSQTLYESATTFWAMWAGLATTPQATKMVEIALPKFEEYGGLVSCTEESRGPIGLDRPNRQWDYPYGWAPQQILAWGGLLKYGYLDDAQRLSFRWLHMITKAFVDYNGVVVEKYDVTHRNVPHRVDAEYGNQGLEFQGIAREGFGWVNASYQYGLTIITTAMRRNLATLTDPDTFLTSERNQMERERSLLGWAPVLAENTATEEEPEGATA
ncbi:alpha,alpha-trehalase nth1 [Rhizina undulata]